jgi:ABC-type nitrate/sulfonate/bicarbonate transport system substrate-binding protein
MGTDRHLITALALSLTATSAHAQPAAAPRLTIGIYAPSVEFGTAQARLAYVQGLAKAIEQSTGIKTDAQSYASLQALRKDSVDFAIIDGPCYATNPSWKLIANASIGGGPTRVWALFSSGGDTIQSLRGKKLAFVQTGCNDAGFIDNAMLDSEVDPAFFGGRGAEKDLTAAVAAVSSYKTAQAVFAPIGSAKGLTKVFDTGAVPNPAFVELAPKLPGGVADKIAAAVIAYGGSGAIAGWTKPSREPYLTLAARMGRVVKAGVLATPEPVRIDGKDVVLDPPTLREPGFVTARHHFVRPSGDRME